MPILTRTDSDASDKIPPTTGTKEEMVTFVAFSAAASVVPLTIPVMLIYVINTISIVFKSHVMICFTVEVKFFIIQSLNAQLATENIRKRDTIGSKILETNRLRMLINMVVPVYRAADALTAPWAANAMVRTGQSSFPYSQISCTTVEAYRIS